MAARTVDPLWTNTTVRIERSLLRDLKVAAIGIRHVLALHQKRMARIMARTAG